jgi:hypothetical protein
MALRESGARYKYGLSRLRIRAKNDDLTVPAKDNMIGGAGPFDFSGAAAPAAVTGFIKRDSGEVEDFTIDLDDAGIDIEAVTVDQWVSAMTAGLAAASPAITGITASKQTTTNRAKLVSSTGVYIQFYGEAAELAMFGQGRGLKAVKSDTAQTMSVSPTVKEDTTQTITDASMKDTEVIIEGYKKGWTGQLVDTVEDFEMMELIESGTLDATGLIYTDPDSSTRKVEVEIEVYHPLYGYGTNSEDQIVGWQHEHYKAVKGSVGEESKAAGFGTKTYALTGTNYKDAAGVESGGIVRTRLAVTAWSPEAFDLI